MTPTQAEMQAAIDAINEWCGFDIRAPWECDLDDRELEQFNGLCAAVAAAKRVAAQVAATNAQLAAECTSGPPQYKALETATRLLEQALACIMHETPEDMTFGEAEDDTMSKIREFLSRSYDCR